MFRVLGCGSVGASLNEIRRLVERYIVTRRSRVAYAPDILGKRRYILFNTPGREGEALTKILPLTS